VCKALGHEFGHHRTFQLATHSEASQEARRLTLQQRGYFAFAEEINYETLHEWLAAGWTVQDSRLSADYDMDQLRERLGEVGTDWIPLASITSDGSFRLHTEELPIRFRKDWRLLYFAPATKNGVGGN